MILTDDRQNFYNACIDVVMRHGIKQSTTILSYNGDGFIYSDQLIYIGCSIDTKWVEIERKAESNPIVWVENGAFLRFDYEYIYLWNHINRIRPKDIEHAQDSN